MAFTYKHYDSPEYNQAQKQVYTVFELTHDVKNLIEGHFGSITVRGEISNFKTYPSGHLYFTLKDAEAQMNVVMFKGFNQHLGFEPEDGDAVVIQGRVSIYEARGQYQLIATNMKLDGIGALQQAFEKLKTKLSQQGYFDATNKKELPQFPQTLGIITSQSGAVLHDILTVTKRRFAGLSLIIYPVKVQGEGAAQEIAGALSYFSQNPIVDVIIVGRGGGSLEDLWAFNEESVAKAVFDCPIPVVSAVGHETDFSICDFVADVRAPTPSAAAELCVPLRSELEQRIDDYTQSFTTHTVKHINSLQTHVGWLKKSLPTPQVIFERIQNRARTAKQELTKNMQKHLTQIAFRLSQSMPQAKTLLYLHEITKQRVTQTKQNIKNQTHKKLTLLKNQSLSHQTKLELLSPKNILKRGYTITQNPHGQIIKTKRQALKEQALTIVFQDGKLSQLDPAPKICK